MKRGRGRRMAYAAVLILVATTAAFILFANAHRFPILRRAARHVMAYAVGGKETLDVIWGPMCRSMVRAGPYYVVGEGMGLSTLARSPGGKLTRMHTVRLGSSVRALHKAHDLIYAAAGGEGMVVVRVRDDGLLKILNRDPEANYALALVSAGDRLFLVGKEGAGLRIYDLRSPSRPKLLGQYGQGGNFSKVLVQGSRVFLAGNGSVEIIGIEDPAVPRPIARLEVSGTKPVHGTDPAPGDMALLDSTLLVVNGDEGVWSVNVQDPTRPFVERKMTDGEYYDNILLDHKIGFLGRRAKGPAVIDFSDTASPHFLGQIHESGHPVGIDSGELFLARASKGMGVYTLAERTPPILSAAYVQPPFAYSVTKSGPYLYVPSGGHGIRIFSVEKPLDPREVGHLETPGLAHSARVIHGKLWISDVIGGLAVADLSAPASPRIEHTYHKGNHPWKQAEGPGGEWVLADGQHGLSILDVTQGIPRAMGEASANGYAVDVAVNSNYAYLATIGNWVQIFQINPLPPASIGTLAWPRLGILPVPSPALSIAAEDGKLYVGSAIGKVLIYALDDPSHPSALGAVSVGGPVYGFEVSGSRVWAAIGKKGVVRIDVTNPTKPKISRRIHVPGTAMGLAVSDGIVYIAAGEAGLQTADVDSDDNR